MDRKAIAELAQNFVLFSGTTEKYLRLLTDEDLTWKPKEGMWTVGELLVHIYSFAPTLTGIESGEITLSMQQSEEEILKKMKIDQLIAYQKQLRQQYLDFVTNLSEADLERQVHVFYGDFSAAMLLGFIYDEHLHHRGQLSIYLRLMGKELPFAYDYESNEPLQ